MTAEPPLPAPLSLWDWAVAAYGAEGVSEACLELQDSAGQSVCLLLWAAWTASTGRAVDAETLDAAVDTARAWHSPTIDSLREVRRALKRPHPDMPPADREAVRDRVKAAELMAERCLLNALEALVPQAEAPARAPLTGLLEVARAWSTAVPRSGLETLAQCLPA